MNVWMPRAALPTIASLCFASFFLLTGCDLFSPDSGDDEDSKGMTTVGSDGGVTVFEHAYDPSVSFHIDNPKRADGANAGFTYLQCTPDGRYVTAGSLSNPPGTPPTITPISSMEKKFDDAIDADKRAISDIDSRARQCRGKSKGLTDYDAARGCDRPQYRRMSQALSEIKWQRSTPGLAPAREKELFNQEQALVAQRQPFAGPCEYAEELYEQDPCNVSRLAGDAWTRARAVEELPKFERQRDLLKKCEDDMQRVAQGPTGIRTPTTEDVLIHALPGIIGTFGSRPPRERHDREPAPGSSGPSGHTDSHGDHH